MKRVGKFIMIAALCVVLILVAAISLTIGWRPFLGPRARALTSRTFESTPQRLERGRYLVRAVGDCMGCHSPHDWTKDDPPILPGMEGAGQDMTIVKDLPGHVVAANLTPDPETGAGTWSDDALARAIREGIGHDGRTLFPFMPYENFRRLSDEDVASIVVYLRSLPPVRNALPQTEIIFPVKYLIRSVPQPITAPVPPPDLSDPLKRGAYLLAIADCSGCHTPQDKGQQIRGMGFGGGMVLEGPWGKVASANITPDPSGIAHYDEGMFLKMIRTGYSGARKINQIMPWHVFRNMTDEDLKSVYAYLRTIPPVKHRVDNTEPAALCPLDKTIHGGGGLN